MNNGRGQLMARKIYPYSLDRKDAKIAGVASTIGAMIGVDPTFIRLGFVAAAIFISFKLTLLAYAAIGIYLVVQKKKAATGADRRRMSDFDRMGTAPGRKPSVHAMRTDLDETDRRLMAIDHHINTQNDELAREIEALRQEEK
jgi:phage shock protein PspC (stress-responsive transcriptional regulator)